MKSLILLTIGLLLGCATPSRRTTKVAQIRPTIRVKKAPEAWRYIRSRESFFWTTAYEGEAINTFFSRPYFSASPLHEDLIWKGKLLSFNLVGVDKAKILKILKSNSRPLTVHLHASHLLDNEILNALANRKEVSIEMDAPSSSELIDIGESVATLTNIGVLNVNHIRVDDFLENINPGLKNLRIEHSSIEDEGMVEISHRFPHLKSFHFSGQVGDGALRAVGKLKELKTLVLSSEKLSDKSIEYISQCPALEELEIFNAKISDRGLEKISRLEHLKILGIFGREKRLEITNKGMGFLDNLPQLEKLSIVYTQVTDAGLAPLRQLKNLRELSLSHNEISDEGLIHLSPLKKLKTLTLYGIPLEKVDNIAKISSLGRLRLYDTKLDDASMAPLGNLELEELRLGGTKITGKVFKTFKHPGLMKILYLRKTEMGDGGLVGIRRFTNLTVLNLKKTKVTDIGMKHLIRLRHLKHLSLNDTSISSDGLRDIGRLYSLNSLDLEYTIVDDEGMKSLSGLLKLNYLNLTLNRIGSKGLYYIRGLYNLKSLYLTSLDMDDSGMQYVNELKKLRVLVLDKSAISDEGIKALSGLHLEFLSLVGTRVSDGSVEALSRMKSLFLIDFGEIYISIKVLKKALPHTHFRGPQRGNFY